MDRQLRKGLLEFCVLAAIKEEDSYGYKMIEDISPYIEIFEQDRVALMKVLDFVTGGKVNE